jgi:hypothetical protein
MSQAISATLLGSTVAILASLGKLATPHFASAPKPSRQALVPMVKMFPMRRDCHGLPCLGGLLCLPAKLNNFSALLPPRAFQRFPKNRWHVKLNHLRHDYPPVLLAHRYVWWG